MSLILATSATCKCHLTAVWWKDRRDVFAISNLRKKPIEQVMNEKISHP